MSATTDTLTSVPKHQRPSEQLIPDSLTLAADDLTRSMDTTACLAATKRRMSGHSDDEQKMQVVADVGPAALLDPTLEQDIYVDTPQQANQLMHNRQQPPNAPLIHHSINTTRLAGQLRTDFDQLQYLLECCVTSNVAVRHLAVLQLLQQQVTLLTSHADDIKAYYTALRVTNAVEAILCTLVLYMKDGDEVMTTAFAAVACLLIREPSNTTTH